MRVLCVHHEHACALKSPWKCAVYVVFGASGGIGSALCHRLALQPGAKVALVGRNPDKLEGIRAQLSPTSTTSVHVADVLDSKQASEI